MSLQMGFGMALLIYTLAVLLALSLRDLTKHWLSIWRGTRNNTPGITKGLSGSTSSSQRVAAMRVRVWLRLQHHLYARARYQRLRHLLLHWDRRLPFQQRPRLQWTQRQLSLLFQQKHPTLLLPHRTPLSLRRHLLPGRLGNLSRLRQRSHLVTMVGVTEVRTAIRAEILPQPTMTATIRPSHDQGGPANPNLQVLELAPGQRLQGWASQAHWKELARAEWKAENLRSTRIGMAGVRQGG